MCHGCGSSPSMAISPPIVKCYSASGHRNVPGASAPFKNMIPAPMPEICKLKINAFAGSIPSALPSCELGTKAGIGGINGLYQGHHSALLASRHELARCCLMQQPAAA